jgi:hypothetical protein
MESLTQDPKYIIIDGKLANAKTREFIPDDEPIFILRGKDVHAYGLISAYLDKCKNAIQRVEIHKRLIDFLQFKNIYASKMKKPD